jgi:cell division protein FtsI/penicillin-binding protein 2
MSDVTNKVHRQRLRVLIGAIIAIGALVIMRLFSLQVIHSTSYKEKAQRQYVTTSDASFDRGNIYFSTKDGTTVAAATIVNGFKLAITPALVVDIERTYTAINQIVPIDREAFFAKAAKKNDPYEEIENKISEQDAEAITALELPGVALYREKWRLYPGNELAAKVLGFVSFRKDTLTGSYGLEEYYNDTLARAANNLYVNFFAEIFANVKSGVFKNTAVAGDVVTSIEPTVQTQLEQTITKIQETWGSDVVGGVVMDPYTGAIVAMAGVPGFDLNQYGSVKNPSVYLNPAVQSRYEMGSIIKPLVMAGAIDRGAVTPTTAYTDRGSVAVADRVFSNFDKKGRGANVSMQQVLNESLNTGMIFVEQRMGKENFREYMVSRYKLGEKTGIDLPGEVNGSVSSLKENNDVNFAAASFGQGIATSPINIVRGFAALANGGTIVTPHVATAVVESSGYVQELEYPHSTTPVLKPETISTMATMLTRVVDDGYKRGLKHYSVAAKTGTAQIARPDGAGYYTDRNLHSLIGYFPASKPRFVLYLFNVYPKGELFAIQTLGDPFFDMIEFLGTYYDIAPDR